MKLNRKILLVTIGVLFISLLISSIINIINFRKNYTEALITGSYGLGQSLNSVISEMLDLGLPLDSLAGMDKKVKQLVGNNPYIGYAAIYDLTGRALFDSNSELVGKVFTDEVMKKSIVITEPLTQIYHRFDGHEYYDVTLPIFDSDKTRVGIIRLGFRTEVVTDKVRGAIVYVIINFTLSFLIIAFLINLLLSRMVSKPVMALSDQARKIAAGHFDTATPVTGNDEIGELSGSLNAMAATIKSQLEALQSSRDDLEQQVVARTSELQNANRDLGEKNKELVQTIALKNELATRQQVSESKYRLLFESSPDAVILLDETHILDCNEATLKMFGCRDVAEFCSLHIDQISPPIQPNGSSSAQRIKDAIRATFANGSQFFEWVHRRFDTRADFSTEVLLNAFTLEGKPLLQAVVRDISERKQAEETVRGLNAELGLRVAQRTAQLEAANKELEEFSYSMSHDMRTPLRALDGFSKILLEDHGDRLDDEGKRLLKVLRDSSQHMGRLIDDILHYLSMGMQRMEFGPIDIAKLASEILTEFQTAAPDRRVRLEIGALPQAWGDRDMIREALQNLLSNAIKFSPADAEAVVELGGVTEKDENIYSVTDHGVGFDMRYADKLFRVFERVHPTGQYEGSGIGLALVKRIVARHGGRVWAAGKINEGATIYFALPTREKQHV